MLLNDKREFRNVKLLKKIEELTLYLIEKDSRLFKEKTIDLVPKVSTKAKEEAKQAGMSFGRDMADLLFLLCNHSISASLS
ncbi:MAG: hypothetical protein JWR67_2746 [Mucilaginibacter sp.]|nr:hypothetical protein [Mucilaginibacter sp.]